MTVVNSFHSSVVVRSSEQISLNPVTNSFETHSLGHTGRSDFVEDLLTEIGMCVYDALCKNEEKRTFAIESIVIRFNQV